MQSMREISNEIEFGNGESLDGISILPLRIKKPLSTSFSTISEAIKQKTVEILESESVNHLKLKISNPEDHILIPFLQVVGGGKQDRMVTRPLLVKVEKANEIVDIPVNCIERGRWQYSRQSTGEQTSGQFFTHNKVRMSPSMGSFNISASQQQTWSSIDYYQAKKNVSRDLYASSSFMEVEEAVQKEIDQESKLTSPIKKLLTRGISAFSNQTGLAFFIGKKLQAVELYGSPRLWKSQAEAVINSFLSEIDLHESIDEKIDPDSLKEIFYDQFSKIKLSQETQDSYGKLNTSSSEEKYSSLVLDFENNFVELYYAPKNDEIEKSFKSDARQIFQTQNQIPEVEQIQEAVEIPSTLNDKNEKE